MNDVFVLRSKNYSRRIHQLLDLSGSLLVNGQEYFFHIYFVFNSKRQNTVESAQHYTEYHFIFHIEISITFTAFLDALSCLNDCSDNPLNLNE